MAEAPKRFKKREDKFGAARRRRTCSFCGDKRGVIDYKEVNRIEARCSRWRQPRSSVQRSVELRHSDFLKSRSYWCLR
jgi:ribosomal protein S14